MVVPKHICTHCIETHTFDQLNSMSPVFNRNPCIMELTCDELVFCKILFSIKLCEKESFYWFLNKRKIVVCEFRNIWLNIL